MPSYYDAKKKCRVGVMGAEQFYGECDSANATYFRGLLEAWTAAGGELKWGAGGVGLRGQVGGKEVGICFVAPKFAGKQDRIELACTTLVKQVGEARTKKLHDDLHAAAGERVSGKTMISITQPGLLPVQAQKTLTAAFIEML